ncbi:MAG: pentapeptide repeat-containing protein [Candidatus Nitrosopolaris sp.]
MRTRRITRPREVCGHICPVGAFEANANLSRAILSSASLSDADLSRADLSNIETDNRTNFQNVKLTSAYPSSIVTDITTRSIGKESNVKSSSMNTKPPVHKITRYTSDGKPVNQ